MKKHGLISVLAILMLFAGFSGRLYSQNSEKIGGLFSKLSWRSVGPANMGGRTVDIDVVETKPWIIYAAMGPSGVWKSKNNGITWAPVFNKEKTISVGDIKIDQVNPETIWVGTGEATARNSVTIGDGVYKSVDGGKNWINMGLENTRHISRIVLDPENPEIVYVAAQGHLWGMNEERGVYKSQDGGKSWEKILYINSNTGIADLAIDPDDGRILYAAAWDYQRFPYFFYSGGPGSGLYKTEDGGQNWKKLVRDLPEGVMGRIGLAVSRSNPGVVYALIEHKDGGIWRSEDKGETWQRTCDNKTYTQVNFRPFYYSQIRVDPVDDKTVYVFSGGSYVSHDMGGKFKAISGGTHSDHHALWIDPKNTMHLIDGNDGGIDISYDGGRNWRPIKSMAVAEVYQIGYDMRQPYHVYCGLQDNGVWGGPSATYDSAGILNHDWYMLNVMGDGFFVRADPTDHNIVYGNYQMNGLTRLDMRIGRGKGIRPEASLHDPPYRFNWNSPILISSHDAKIVYTGGNYLFKTLNSGHSWDVISPDLSTNDPKKQQDSGGPITPDNTGAEIHCTIITIAESPLNQEIIWCGTDDGNVQVTKDGGKNWTNTVKNIPDLPAATWCSRIEASYFEEGTAYAAFDGHRADDYSTYLYKTTDFGKTWRSLKGNLPFGWIHVVRQDRVNPNLLFVGTEFAIFASLDEGRSWFSLMNNLTTIAVRDIAVHPRDNDLIIGTHGLGVQIMDDITPLQNMSPAVLALKTHFFNIRPFTQIYMSTTQESFGKPEFSGKNPSYGLTMTSYFKERPPARPKIVIRKPDGDKFYEMNLSQKAGLQRNNWNLQYMPKTKDGKQLKPTGMGLVSPPMIPPGTYEIALQVGSQEIVRSAVINPDPRIQISNVDLEKQHATQVEILALTKKMGLAVTAVKKIRRQLDKLKLSIKEKGNIGEDVTLALQGFEKEFLPLEEEITPKGIGYRGSMESALRGGPIGGSVSTMAMFLGMAVAGFPSPATEAQVKFLAEITAEGDQLVASLNSFLAGDFQQLNTILQRAELKALRLPKQIEL